MENELTEYERRIYPTPEHQSLYFKQFTKNIHQDIRGIFIYNAGGPCGVPGPPGKGGKGGAGVKCKIAGITIYRHGTGSIGKDGVPGNKGKSGKSIKPEIIKL